MRALQSYEDLARMPLAQQVVCEAYEGASVVQWYGNIERQLGTMLSDNEASRNFVYTDKIRAFQKIWRENEITGSLNRETLNALKTACDMLSVDAWTLSNYFSNLRDQLRKLIASEEALPRVDMEQNMPNKGPGAGGGGSMPPLDPEFGAGKGGPAPPGGKPPGPGGPPGEPGEEEDLPPA